MKHKRVSRKELKAKIAKLRSALSDLEISYRAVYNERDEIKAKLHKSERRLMELGSRAEMHEVSGAGIECVDIKPEVYGTYFALHRLPDDSIMDFLKEELARKVANALIENNLIQIILHDGKEHGPFESPTIGAKVYVIPWDKCVRSIKLKV